jgi:uncharacterized protein with NRDE domain
MCLIAFALQADPRWPCVIAANRDEAYARPTQPLDAWQSDHGVAVIGGRDARDGGTWMAQSPQGRIAFLTNVRQGLPETGARSRGQLPVGWLAGLSLHDWRQAHPAGAFAGCNIVLGGALDQPWWWLTNRDPHGLALNEWHTQALGPGVYGLSNAALNTPWPKTLRLRQALSTSLASAENPDDLTDTLMAALAQRQRFSDDTLPRTGVPPEAERALSGVFVHWPEHDYGTRSSTVVVVEGGVSRWLERRWDAQAQATGETVLRVPPEV